MQKSLEKGDYIQCNDADDMIEMSNALALVHVETDFCYERNGQKGYWLEVLEVG